MLITTGRMLAISLSFGLVGQTLPAHAAPDGATAPVLLAQAGPAALQPTADDHVLGKADAPITIVEYASMTCGHCAAFHVTMLPELKTKYIDTGKVRLVFRDFPLDAVALQVSQIAECAGKDRYFGVVGLAFETQGQWAVAKDPLAELGKSLRIAGITEADIKTCVANDKGAMAIVAERQAAEKLGVNSTPTLFINGERYDGARTMEAFDEAFAKILKK
jgi:protein-disulfide isomerase